MSRMPVSRRPRRRWLLLAIPLVLLAAIAVSLRLLLQPERMGALMVAQAESATGLRFELDQPARLGLWPNLHLELIGLRVHDAAAAATLLRAARVDLSLPLSVLWAERPEIGRIDLLQPDIDLDAVGRWLQGGAEAGPPAALSLPEFATLARASDGRLRLGDRLLEDIELQLDPIREGQPLRLDLRASLVGKGERRPLSLSLDATPRQRSEGIRLESITLRFGQPNALGHGLELLGDVDLFLPQTLRLDLLMHLPQPWLLPLPTLPDEAAALLAGPLTIAYDGPGDLSASLRAERSEGGSEFRLIAVPSELLAWIADPAASPLPPAALHLALPAIDIEGFTVEGLRIEQEPDPPAVAPAPP